MQARTKNLSNVRTSGARLRLRLTSMLIGLAITAVFLYCPRGDTAHAAPAPKAGQRKAHEPEPVRKRRTGGDSQIEEFDIVGKIYKPEVFVFLGRKTLNLSWDLDDPRFKRSFLDAVINSVWGPPF
jgi:hypothetical protein